MKLRTIYLFIMIILSSHRLICAQEQFKLNTGIELDALPYLNGGYYGSVWTGCGNIRLRAVITKTDIPSLVVRSGFDDLNTRAYALLMDYFPNKDYNGLWTAVGFEYWENSVKNSKNKISGSMNDIQFTAGGGYTWKFWHNFYLNPWYAVHLRVGGNSEKLIGGVPYKSSLILPEASVKLGWYF